MHQKLSCPHRIKIKPVSLLIWADMYPDQKDLAFLYLNITVLKIDFAGAEGFHLRSGKNYPCLKFLINKVVMESLTVLGNDFDSLLNCHRHLQVRVKDTHSYPKCPLYLHGKNNSRPKRS